MNEKQLEELQERIARNIITQFQYLEKGVQEARKALTEDGGHAAIVELDELCMAFHNALHSPPPNLTEEEMKLLVENGALIQRASE